MLLLDNTEDSLTDNETVNATLGSVLKSGLIRYFESTAEKTIQLLVQITKPK